MKPKSIISLIIAAVFVIGGIITCLVASSMAKSDDIMLFPKEDVDGNLIYSMNLEGISKISISSEDADITVVGGAESSSIEVINFNANYYKLTSSNGTLSFAQIDDFMSMFKFWDNGFSFKGMRYILRMGDDVPGNKKVIVNLKDGDDIRLVNLSTETGKVNLEKCSFAADYTVKAENGKATIKNLSGAKSLNIFGNTSEITATSCDTTKLVVNGNSLKTVLRSVTAKESSVMLTDGSLNMDEYKSDTLSVTSAGGSISITDYAIGDGNINTVSGNVTLDLQNTDSITAYAATKSGKISVNGEFKDSFTVDSANPTYKVTVTTESGDVTVTHP